MNPKRGPLNEPNSPEEVPKSDRYLIEDKTFDKHFDEAWAESRIDDKQVEDMYSRKLSEFAQGCSFSSLNDVSGPKIPHSDIIGQFKAELGANNLSYIHETQDTLYARSKNNDIYFFRRS